ncbi:MAG: methyltransferase domain-containing protein [Chloroflexota bacterium]|nr:methyltransferase domain-containing protein [Chloroflexota bacterium]
MMSFDPLAPPVDVLLESWARRVRENREQVERFGEQMDGPDRYAPVAGRFRADPRRADEPALDALRSLARPDETWLDIGAGGGRYSLPLALAAREVIALDPSEGMLGVLREGMDEHGIHNIRIVPGRWPAAAAARSDGTPVAADVAFIAHVGYDVEEIGSFLDGMERAARRLCVAMLFWRRPTWAADALWPAVHGVERATLPALRELLTVLLARGRTIEVREVPGVPIVYDTVEQALAFARHQTWVRPDGEKDRRLQHALAERLIERDGRYAFDWAPSPLGIITWAPPTE